MKHGMGIKSIGGLLFIRMAFAAKSQRGLLCNYLEGVPHRRVRFMKGSVVVGSRTGEMVIAAAASLSAEGTSWRELLGTGRMASCELRREGWSVSC